MSKFRFKRLDRVGVPDADEDREYLEHCFVGSEDLESLLACSDSRRVIVGGTGTGKTALLRRVEQQARGTVISVLPEGLALSHIANSTVLNYVLGLGVKLDLFFKLLWRHVFAVEILRAHFKVYTEDDQVKVFTRFLSMFNPDNRRAIKYMEEWGKTFWKETDFRVKELTHKLERDIKASVAATLPGVNLSSGDSSTLTQQQVTEVVERAQHVVNQVQIRELSHILDMLDAVLEDPQQPYFILIDRLDENWVEDRFRYLLVRALLETVRDFRKVRNAKIIVALRRDLVDRVFKLTRDAGFQQEKFESIFLPLNWSTPELVEFIEKRLRHLIDKRTGRAAGARIDVHSLLPKAVDDMRAAEYVVSRTLMRPRDVIQFLNACIEQSVNQPHVTLDMLRQGEGVYSPARLRAVADEWAADYPSLLHFTRILKNRAPLFPLEDIDDASVSDACLEFAARDPGPTSCPLGTAALKTANATMGVPEFRRTALDAFYRVGLVGFKLESHEAPHWAYSGRKSISSAELEHPGIRVAVHPAFWRTLGIRSRPE